MRDEDVLGAFREDPLPPSGVDLARAVRTGRRRHRLRTAGAAGGLALLLAAGGLAAPVWLAPGGTGPGQVGGTPDPTVGPPPPQCPSPGASPATSSRAPAGASPSTKDGTAPAEFDVLRRVVDVDGVSGLHLEHYVTARHWQRVTLFDAAERIHVDVQVFARGGKPQFSDGPGTPPVPVDLAAATPADPVGDLPASWLSGRQALYQHDVARLGWQWAEGGWAFVAAADTSVEGGHPPTAEQTAALRAIAHEVAQALRIGGAGRPVTMPFTAPVPGGDCLRLTGTLLHRGTNAGGTAFSRTTLSFGRRDNTDPMAFPPDVTGSVTADSAAVPADTPGAVTGQVDGHPAAMIGGTFTLYGVGGFALEITGPLTEQQMTAYARSVEVVEGAHGDESKWTDRPLRQ
ncbi:hypothetical protein [Catellatospora sp. NPDC049609]|uniref:hypothetical protein n=1 Tax=Catellatospora sp. NPDC049609 TaxID=3155505 RepID=UPI003448CBC9